jgi:hypothetical protein
MTDGQSASLSWYQANIWDQRTIFLSLSRKLYSDIWGFLLAWGVLSDERTGLYFAVHIAQWSQSRRTHNHILLSLLTLGSLFVASYESQGYGGGILTRLHTRSFGLVPIVTSEETA